MFLTKVQSSILVMRSLQLFTYQKVIRKYSTTTMDALQYIAKTKKLELVKKEIPKNIGDKEILVQVHYAGICGTDLHIIDGDFPCKQDGPLVLGHEFVGVVSKIGNKIKHVKVGDKVVNDPNQSCNVCSYCRTGLPHYCKDGGLNAYRGIYFDGGWEQYVLVPDIQILKMPDSITLEQASLCEPTACVSHAWEQISPVPVGSRILIVGSGIIGNLFVATLHLRGHRKVTVSEPSADRLNILKKLDCGFELITPDTLKQRQQKNPDYLFDVVIDCSGNQKALEHAFTLMDYGAKMCIFGVANPKAKMSISPFDMFNKELTIHGVLTNPFSFPKALSLLESMGTRYITYDKLGVKTFSLKDYPDAIKQLRNGSIAKATFKIQH